MHIFVLPYIVNYVHLDLDGRTRLHLLGKRGCILNPSPHVSFVNHLAKLCKGKQKTKENNFQ